MGDGTALHWYRDDTDYGSEPLLETIYDTQTCGEYLVARVGVELYMLYPIQVQSLSEANEKRTGPLERKELMQTLTQVAADTILHQAGPF